MGILGFLILASLDPRRFAEFAKAYELMADGCWALLTSPFG